jgi:tetratricopeptide (TPR) repeat protein
VWGMVDADSPRVRKAARETWLAYVTGPPPKPAPMAKLNLPGGKKTKKAKPLYLTYRELADNELRKAANEILHEDYPLADPSIDDNETSTKTVKVDVEDLTKRLFAYYDAQRAKADSAQWDAAKKQADAGDLATATAAIDRMLASNSDRPERAEMAQVYFKWGKALEAKQQWLDASSAYSKAHGLDPKGPHANEALAAHHFTHGKAQEALGKDGGPDFRRAVSIMPTYGSALKSAADATSAEQSGKRPIWMLYASIGAAVIALALFGLAMVRRRA